MLVVLRISIIIVLLLILLLITTAVTANTIHNHRVDQEAREVLGTATPQQKKVIQQADLASLPPCIKKWLERSGVVGKEKIHTVRLTQTGRMRLEEGKPWLPLEAVQYINVDEPGFVWRAQVKMAPLINLVGRDKYHQGHGSMQFKLLALLPVADAKPGQELDQGTLLRFLAEMIWYPTAALNDYITWEEIDANSARATMTWQGVNAAMVFNFNDAGDLVSNVAPRYREVKGSYVLDDWGGVARGYGYFNGIRIVNKTDILWKYKTGDFNWLQIEVTDIAINQLP